MTTGGSPLFERWLPANWVGICLVAGLVIRLQGLGWDEWLQLHPDERNIVDAVLLLSQNGSFLPDFLAYNGLSLYFPLAIASLVSSVPDAADITWAARLLSALFGSASILVGYLIAERISGNTAGQLAAFLLAFSAPLLQWSHFGTTESALVFFVLCLWWLALRLLSGETTLLQGALQSGLAIGVACGFKSSALAIAVIPVAAFVMLLPKHRLSLLAPCMAGTLLAVLVFVISTPAVLFTPHKFLSVMYFENGVATGAIDVFWTWQFVDATDGLFELRSLWQMLDGGVLLLAAAGLAMLPAKRLPMVLPALVFAILYGTLIVHWHAKFARYLAPVLPILLIFAALGACRLLRTWSKSLQTAVFLVLLLSFTSGVTMALSFQADDPRIAATRFLQREMAAVDIVLREPADVGAPLFGGHKVSELPLLDEASSAKLDEMASSLAKADWLVINSRRHWAVLPKLPDRFPLACQYYASLQDGGLGFREVARFTRKQFLRGLLYPGLNSEETRVVFDRPEVIVYRRVVDVSRDVIADRISDRTAPCKRLLL